MYKIKQLLIWILISYRFRTCLNKMLKHIQKTKRMASGHALVVISPWFMTQVPWFSMFVAICLYNRGTGITLLIDEMPFGAEKKMFKLQLATIKWLAKRLTKIFQVDYIKPNDQFSFTESEQAYIKKQAWLNVVHDAKGEIPARKKPDLVSLYEKQLKKMYHPIRQYIAETKCDYIVLPGGVSSSSSIFMFWAKHHELRASTFDSGVNTLLISCQGVASQLNDIPSAYLKLLQNKAKMSFVESYVEVELQKRMSGNDHWSTQISNSNHELEEKKFVLLPLNISWDSAALGLHKHYDTSIEWVLDTTRYILNNSSLSVVIRQHPIERHDYAKSMDDYGQILANEFGINERVIFIPSLENVSSYSLIEDASFVIPYTSTIGVESAILGRAVINVSSNYYSELEFNFTANTRKEYYRLILLAINGELIVTAKMKKLAKYCYYLSQVCNWNFTDLAPNSFIKKLAEGEFSELICEKEFSFV